MEETIWVILAEGWEKQNFKMALMFQTRKKEYNGKKETSSFGARIENLLKVSKLCHLFLDTFSVSFY